MPDIYDELAARYLSAERYVFPAGRQGRDSGSFAVLEGGSDVSLVDELALFPGLAGDERFRDTMDWYLQRTHERAAAPQEQDSRSSGRRVARTVRVTQGFLSAGVAGIPPADLPTLVAPLPVVVEEP
jgi:hypothetical protein